MPNVDEIDRVIAGLTPLDRERLTGWQGPPGAAFNAVSEDLCEQGLLNADWSMSADGLAVAARLREQQP